MIETISNSIEFLLRRLQRTFINLNHFLIPFAIFVQDLSNVSQYKFNN